MLQRNLLCVTYTVDYTTHKSDNNNFTWQECSTEYNRFHMVLNVQCGGVTQLWYGSVMNVSNQSL